MATRKKATTTDTSTEEVKKVVETKTEDVKVPKTNLKVAKGTNVKSLCR